MHAELSIGVRGIIFGLNLHLHVFLYSLHMTAAKALVRLCGWAGSFEPWLLINVISTEISYTGINGLPAFWLKKSCLIHTDP